MPKQSIENLLPNMLEREEMQTAEGRVEFLGSQFQIVRPLEMTPGQEAYHEFIQGELVKSFERMSPEVLADPNQLRAVTCVDPNAQKVASTLSPELSDDLLNPDNKVPGGLFFFWKTGLMKAWIAPRMFNPYLIGAQHRGCGALKVAQGPDQRVAQIMRQYVTAEMRREVDEQAAMIRSVWLSLDAGRLTKDELGAIDNFHGPAILHTPISDAGTASEFIRPKHFDTIDTHSIYSLSELLEQRSNWIGQKLTEAEGIVFDGEDAAIYALEQSVSQRNDR